MTFCQLVEATSSGVTHLAEVDLRYLTLNMAITEKSGILSSDAQLRQYAGWSVTSKMNQKYVHFSGGESMKDLLMAKEDKKSVNILQPKTCPNCRESNRPDAQFCHKCNFVMSFGAYQKGYGREGKEGPRDFRVKDGGSSNIL